jgi:hypothetical protein
VWPKREARARADLAEVQSAIAHGQRNEAIAKLQAVALNVPPGQILSKDIGDFFYELGFAEMAGRYWYLLDDKSDAMVVACQKFEHSLANSPGQIADAFMSTLQAKVQPCEWVRLRELRDQARAYRNAHEYSIEPRNRAVQGRIVLFCCATITCLVLFLMAMGVVYITTWFR